MQHEPLTTTGRPSKPDPHQDRSGPAVPKNIAQLLYVVRILLEYGRHLAATLESRAARPGFSLIARSFGTANLPVILAHLTRGIMRAIALQSLLLKRAATGRDLEIKPPRPPSPRAASQVEGSAEEQSRQMIAERAEHDAPLDPGRLPTMKQIEAEVRRRPFGRTIADICRDFGVIPAFCTRDFWDAVMLALACYDGSMLKLLDDMQDTSDRFSEEQPDDDDRMPCSPEMVRRVLGFRLGEPLANPSSDAPLLHDNVAVRKQQTAAAAEATGPPEPCALPIAA
jgi:hypothetical protein